MSIKEQCQEEVDALHRFFVKWFAGQVEEADDVYRRFEDSLADDFEIVPPNGLKVNRRAVIAQLRSTYGSRAKDDPPFRIWIESFSGREVGEGRFLATYEEWQDGAMGRTARQSSALFRVRVDAPGGVEWVHVHETWIE